MKIQLQQLNQHLQKSLASVYLISGDEPLLVQEATTTIANHYKKLDYTEHLRFIQDSSFNWENLLFAANHYSLFADKKIIELKLSNFKIGEGEKILLAYVNNPSPNAVLIINAPKLDANTQKKRWFKDGENKIMLIQIWPLDEKQLPMWLQQKLKIVGLTLDRDALNFLIDYTQGNLLALNQEIEKLSLIYPAGNLNAAQVIEAITDNSRFNIFNLIDEALLGHAKNVARILKSLQQEGLEPAIVLWGIAKELRTLLEIKNSHEALNKIMWKRQPIIKQALQKHNSKKLQHMLQHATTIDLYIKGAKAGNTWDELLRLHLALAGAL
jgi:DNA polymerase-3 subunit delta